MGLKGRDWSGLMRSTVSKGEPTHSLNELKKRGVISLNSPKRRVGGPSTHLYIKVGASVP